MRIPQVEVKTLELLIIHKACLIIKTGENFYDKKNYLQLSLKKLNQKVPYLFSNSVFCFSVTASVMKWDSLWYYVGMSLMFRKVISDFFLMKRLKICSLKRGKRRVLVMLRTASVTILREKNKKSWWLLK